MIQRRNLEGILHLYTDGTYIVDVIEDDAVGFWFFEPFNFELGDDEYDLTENYLSIRADTRVEAGKIILVKLMPLLPVIDIVHANSIHDWEEV